MQMKLSRARLWLLASCLFVSAASQAAPIYYETESLGGNSWKYHYTVDNAASAPVYEFTIYFDVGLYSNLRLATGPSTWDPIAIQPDPSLPDDGFYDALALAAPVNQGEVLSGFSIVFDLLGGGTPGSQAYDIVDPLTFAAIFSGQTARTPSTTPVLEPESFSMLLIGAFLLARLRRRAVHH
jgi:hypothetical protein